MTFGVAVILENVTRMLLLDDVKSNLIATVSHELKTPLTSVRMALYLLHEKTVGPLNEKQGELTAAAKEDADRLLRTLNDLLDLARLERGSAPLQVMQIAPADLVDAAERATRDVVHAAASPSRPKSRPIFPPCPSTGSASRMSSPTSSPTRRNILPGGSEIKVRAQTGQTRAGKPCVRFSVKDQGPASRPSTRSTFSSAFIACPAPTKRARASAFLSLAKSSWPTAARSA